MRTRIHVILLGAALLGRGLTAQSAEPPSPPTSRVSVAVLFDPVLANAITTNRFWLEGGSVDVNARLWRGLGATADLTGLHTKSVSGSAVGLDMIVTTFGLTYTCRPHHGRFAVFAHGLVGEASGFNTVIPNPSGAGTSANSLAAQAGGGVDVALHGRVSVRAFQADWMRTQLPNSTTNVQNDLRLGAGIVVALGSRKH